MSSPRKLSDIQGTKDRRPRDFENQAARSVVTTKDGRKFVLLPGKDRGGMKSTLLGAGAQGIVKKAVDEKGNELAVKILLEIPHGDALFQECEALKKMGDKHAELVRVEYKKDDKACYRVYLFQALVKGKPICAPGFRGGVLVSAFKKYFDAWTRKKQIEITKNLIAMILKIFDLIEDMHKKGVVHRDLHDANVMWDEQSKRGKIIDFGKSTFVEDQDQEIDIKRAGDFAKFSEFFWFSADKLATNNSSHRDDNMKKFIDCLKAVSDAFSVIKDKGGNLAETVKNVRETFGIFSAELDRELQNSNRFYAACRAIRDFFKDKWGKLCNILSCCRATSNTPEENAASYRPLQVVPSAGSSYTRHLLPVGGSAGFQVESKNEEPTEEKLDTYHAYHIYNQPRAKEAPQIPDRDSEEFYRRYAAVEDRHS